MSVLSFLFWTLLILFMNSSHRSHLQMVLPIGHVSHCCFLGFTNGLKGSYFYRLSQKFPYQTFSKYRQKSFKLFVSCQLYFSSEGWAAVPLYLLVLTSNKMITVLYHNLFAKFNCHVHVFKVVLRSLLFIQCTYILVSTSFRGRFYSTS